MAENYYLDEVLENIADAVEKIITDEMKDDGLLTVSGGLRSEIEYYSRSRYRRNKEIYPIILTFNGVINNVTSTQYCQEEHEMEIGFYSYYKAADPNVGIVEAAKIAARIRRIFRRKENLRLGINDGSIILVRSNSFLRDSTGETAQNNVYSSYSSIIVKFRTIEL